MSHPHSKRRKERNKRYVPRLVRTPMLIGSDLVMRPVEQIIEQIERDGTVMVGSNGFPVFQAGDGKWHDSAAGIEGLIWHLEMWCTRHGRELPLQPLRDLHTALKYLVPVMEKNLFALRATLPVLRRAIATSDPDDAIDLLQQTRIKAEIERAAKC